MRIAFFHQHRVGKYCSSARARNGIDDSLRRGAFLLYIRKSVAVQYAAEGIGCVFGVACCGERGSIVDAGRGFAADKIIRNIHAHFAQLDFKQTVALLAKSGLFRKQFLKTRRVDILPDAENVKRVGIVRFGLNSGKHPKPKLCGAGQRGGNSAHAIMVRQCKQLNSGGFCKLGNMFRGFASVGTAGVCVQIIHCVFLRVRGEARAGDSAVL